MTRMCASIVEEKAIGLGIVPRKEAVECGKEDSEEDSEDTEVVVVVVDMAITILSNLVAMQTSAVIIVDKMAILLAIAQIMRMRN